LINDLTLHLVDKNASDHQAKMVEFE
jgi:hypothetical protein